MAHHRKYVAAAVALNTAISVVEAAAGYQANSLSLLMDSVHNLSDEMALVAIWLAAGLLLILTGNSLFDPLIAGGIALWIIVTTAHEVFGSHEELIWPDKIVCGHADHEATA